jgi:hypothetical protein
MYDISDACSRRSYVSNTDVSTGDGRRESDADKPCRKGADPFHHLYYEIGTSAGPQPWDRSASSVV